MTKLTLLQKLFRLTRMTHEFYGDQVDANYETLAHQDIGQGKIMRLLAENAPLSQKELIADLHMKPQSATELLQKLETKQLITRTKSTVDKRTFIINLTPAGRTALQPTSSPDLTLEMLSDAEKEQLELIIDKIWQHIEPQLKKR